MLTLYLKIYLKIIVLLNAAVGTDASWGKNLMKVHISE